MNDLEHDRRWLETINALLAFSYVENGCDGEIQLSGTTEASVRSKKAHHQCFQARDYEFGRWNPRAIKEIQPRTSKTIAVCWCDPTLGRYTDQVWILTAANFASMCVLSARDIRRGDPVYRPVVNGSHVPANASVMMLESSLDPTYLEEHLDEDGLAHLTPKKLRGPFGIM